MDPAVGCPVSRDQVPWGAIRFWKCLASSTFALNNDVKALLLRGSET